MFPSLTANCLSPPTPLSLWCRDWLGCSSVVVCLGVCLGRLVSGGLVFGVVVFGVVDVCRGGHGRLVCVSLSWVGVLVVLGVWCLAWLGVFLLGVPVLGGSIISATFLAIVDGSCNGPQTPKPHTQETPDDREKKTPDDRDKKTPQDRTRCDCMAHPHCDTATFLTSEDRG